MQTISTQQLKSLQQDGGDYCLINTLPMDKFAQTKIPGALNIPQDAADFASQVDKLAGGKDTKIVVYCGNEDCDSSSNAAMKLKNAGFTNVSVYKPGAEGWQKDSTEQQQTSSRR